MPWQGAAFLLCLPTLMHTRAKAPQACKRSTGHSPQLFSMCLYKEYIALQKVWLKALEGFHLEAMAGLLRSCEVALYNAMLLPVPPLIGQHPDTWLLRVVQCPILNAEYAYSGIRC